jgi:hypothetical protein
MRLKTRFCPASTRQDDKQAQHREEAAPEGHFEALRACSRWRVTTPAIDHIRVTATISSTAAALLAHGSITWLATLQLRARLTHAPLQRLLAAGALALVFLEVRLRRRIDLGVISTSSSSSMNSTPYSSVSSIGGVILIASPCH